MLNSMGEENSYEDPIKKLRGIIQSVSVLTFISKILLKYFLDPCIFFVVFQLFQCFGIPSILTSSIDS